MLRKWWRRPADDLCLVVWVVAKSVVSVWRRLLAGGFWPNGLRGLELAVMSGDVAVKHEDYFTKIAGTLNRPERLEMARRQGRKTVALVGAAVPEELFWACGAVPISVGRFAGPSGIGEALPRDTCAVVRTGFDLLVQRWIPAGLVDAVVVASGCDWMARLTDHLVRQIGDLACAVWPLDISRTIGPTSIAASLLHSRLGSLEKMLGTLEQLTDLPLTRRAFEAARERVAAVDALCERLDHLRAESPPLVRALQYCAIIGARDLADPERWADALENFIGHQPSAISHEPYRIQNRKSEIQNPRVVLSGCPTGFPDLALVELIEQTGFQIVGEDSGPHRIGGPVRPGSRGGRRAILQWAAETLEAGQVAGLSYENRRAAGVIRLHYRGCAVSAMEEARMRSQLAERAIPVLTLEVEQVPSAPEALRTHLEAFRERLKSETTDCTDFTDSGEEFAQSVAPSSGAY